jgi:hypothetical protein
VIGVSRLVTVGLGAASRIAAWRDPVWQFERTRRRAWRSLAFRLFVVLGLAAITASVGAGPGFELGEVVWGAATVAAAVVAIPAALRVWRLEHTSPPAPLPRPAPLPPRSSVVRPALERLAERERVLADLLVHTGPVAAETSSVAADAAGALRTLGTCAVAVEQARRSAPAGGEAGLDTAIGLLVRQLEDGVAAYDALVAATADVVTASVTLQAGDPVRAARLADATDALAGLARGLREVTPRSVAAPRPVA